MSNEELDKTFLDYLENIIGFTFQIEFHENMRLMIIRLKNDGRIFIRIENRLQEFKDLLSHFIELARTHGVEFSDTSPDIPWLGATRISNG